MHLKNIVAQRQCYRGKREDNSDDEAHTSHTELRLVEMEGVREGGLTRR